MTLADQIYAQALVLAGQLTAEQDALLRLLSRAAQKALEARLRAGVRTEDCMAELAEAGSLYALAALSESDGSPERFTAGDLTVQRGSSCAAARCLRHQADLLILPYTRDNAVFLGV